MIPVFFALATLTLLSAIGAVALRKPVHCALCLVVTFVGIAGLFLQLNSQFLALAQVLVYVGAVVILILFALLLTRTGEPESEQGRYGFRLWGLLIAVAVSAILSAAVLTSTQTRRSPPAAPELSVKDLGQEMLGRRDPLARSHYVLPLQAMAVLLTAALIGAATLVLPLKRERNQESPSNREGCS